MYISEIHIKNYRNFNDFKMRFHKGLNVLIGSNNSGKTGLLHAIYLLKNFNSTSIDDFNKNNLIKYEELYKNNAPEIIIEYTIEHTIIEDDFEDESIIKLLSFISIEGFNKNLHNQEDKNEYNIHAKVIAKFTLDIRYLEDYKKELSSVKNYKQYITMLNHFVKEYYEWSFSNNINEDDIEPSKVQKIFDIRLIQATRTGDDVEKEIKKEVEKIVNETNGERELDQLKESLSNNLKEMIDVHFSNFSNIFQDDNKVGLKKGNVSILSEIKPDFSISDFYITEVKDTKNNYSLPLNYNGLGYNNLINIYMLIKLTEIHKGRDFKILCLEEPEAHLHPAMQYKLFKYIKNLDRDNRLNQQIFVTTHSSNITAVAGIDNIFMLSYERSDNISECFQQSLDEQFKGSPEKIEAKLHLTKFLDVTRSDMLFADKVILVEGLAEKLLLPTFMNNCNYSYEDEHISIVEIGGKCFDYFIELFNKNAVNKKVLCITDKDFKRIEEEKLESFDKYDKYIPEHVKKINEKFKIDNCYIISQNIGGSTFEDELFLINFENTINIKNMFKKVAPTNLNEFIDDYEFDIDKRNNNLGELNKNTQEVVKRYLDAFNNRIDKDSSNFEKYKKICFAELFLYYVKNKKGDFALGLLTDPKLSDGDEKTKILVPEYIKRGLEWLKK